MREIELKELIRNYQLLDARNSKDSKDELYAFFYYKYHGFIEKKSISFSEGDHYLYNEIGSRLREHLLYCLTNFSLNQMSFSKYFVESSKILLKQEFGRQKQKLEIDNSFVLIRNEKHLCGPDHQIQLNSFPVKNVKARTNNRILKVCAVEIFNTENVNIDCIEVVLNTGKINFSSEYEGEVISFSYDKHEVINIHDVELWDSWTQGLNDVEYLDNFLNDEMKNDVLSSLNSTFNDTTKDILIHYYEKGISIDKLAEKYKTTEAHIIRVINEAEDILSESILRLPDAA